MCDFGGTPFGACYLNKKIIFLNNLNKKTIQSFRSNDLLTRNLLIKNLKNFFNLKSADVALFIKNTNWLNQKNKTIKIRKKVFYDQKIVTPKTVSNQIKEILKIKAKKIDIKKFIINYVFKNYS